MRVLALTVLFIFLASTGWCKSNSDSLTFQFRQELNVRHWDTRLLVQTEGDRWSFRNASSLDLRERVLQGYEPQWTEEYKDSLNVARRITKSIDGLLEVYGQHFQDREVTLLQQRGSISLLPQQLGFPQSSGPVQSGLSARLQRGTARAGAAVAVSPEINFDLLAGAASDRQLRGSGSGLSMRGLLAAEEPSGWPVRFRGEGNLDRYGERQNHTLQAQLSTRREFGEARDRLHISARQHRSDIFLGTGRNIVHRLEKEVAVRNRLEAPLGKAMNGAYDLVYRNSSVDYKSGGPGSGRELDFTHDFSISRQQGRMRTRLAYLVGLEDREYGENLILGRRQKLNLEGVYANWRHQLRAEYGVEKLRFDSPDTTELSDRDRLIHRFRLTAEHWLTRRALITLESLVLLDHLVHLNSQRSADNRWNRVFSLKPSVIWSPGKGWRNSTSVDLLANYSVYDFEFSDSGAIRSNVLRRWSVADTIRAPIHRNWRLEIAGRLDLEDRGRIHWEKFVQEVSDESRAYYASFVLERSFWGLLKFRSGYAYQNRQDDQLAQNLEGERERIRIRDYRAQGPTVSITSMGKTKLRIMVEGRFLHVEDSRQEHPYRLDSFQMLLAYRW